TTIGIPWGGGDVLPVPGSFGGRAVAESGPQVARHRALRPRLQERPGPSHGRSAVHRREARAAGYRITARHRSDHPGGIRPAPFATDVGTRARRGVSPRGQKGPGPVAGGRLRLPGDPGGVVLTG